MKLSEQCIKILKEEGFPYIYKWETEPNTSYSEQQHQDKVTVFVTRGTLYLTVTDRTYELNAGERFDISPLALHSGITGPKGAQYVIGVMIEGDS